MSEDLRTERCNVCGHKVNGFFDHIAIDCEHDMTQEEVDKMLAESETTPKESTK